MSEPYSEQDIAVPPTPKGTRARTALLGVLTVAAIATVGLLGTLTFYEVTDHQAAAKAAVEAERNTVDKIALAVQVRSGVQELVNSKNNYGITFEEDLTLFQLVPGGSEYTGLVTARTKKGTEVPVQVTVYADEGGTLFYQIEPGSQLRLTQTASDEEPKECGYYSQCE